MVGVFNYARWRQDHFISFAPRSFNRARRHCRRLDGRVRRNGGMAMAMNDLINPVGLTDLQLRLVADAARAMPQKSGAHFCKGFLNILLNHRLMRRL